MTDDLVSRVRGAIDEALADKREMVTKWTAVVEVIGDDGKRATYTLSADDMTLWDTLGLLTYSLQVEQAMAVVREQGG